MISRTRQCGALAGAAATFIVGAVFLAIPAAAEAEFPAARLEMRWQADLAGERGQTLDANSLRLRVHDDGRIAFGVIAAGGPGTAPGAGPHTLLVTLDADGKTVHRVPARGPRGTYGVIPLPDGDFLLHAATETAIELRRHGADGRLRFASTMPLGAGNHAGMLHDAALRADGRLIAMGSVGLVGPNDTIMLAAFDVAGRRVWNYRARLVSFGSEFNTRLYRLAPVGGRERFAILGNSERAPNSVEATQFVKLFDPDDRASVNAAPIVFSRGGEMRCSTQAADGSAIVGIVPEDAQSLAIRWYDAARVAAGSHRFDIVGSCDIAIHRDGRSLVRITPYEVVASVFAFNPAGAPLWRFEFGFDVAAVGWMPDGDIVVVSAANGGFRVIRYTAR